MNNCCKRINLQLWDTKNEQRGEKRSVRLFNNSICVRSTTARQIRYCSHAWDNLLWFFCSLVLLSLSTFLITLLRKSNQQGAIIERVNQTTINKVPNFFCAPLQRLHSRSWKTMEIFNVYVNSQCSSFFLLFLANRLMVRTGSQLLNGNKFSISVKVWFFYHSGGCILWIPLIVLGFFQNKTNVYRLNTASTALVNKCRHQPKFIFRMDCLPFASFITNTSWNPSRWNFSWIYNFHRIHIVDHCTPLEFSDMAAQLYQVVASKRVLRWRYLPHNSTLIINPGDSLHKSFIAVKWDCWKLSRAPVELAIISVHVHS